MAKKDFDNRRAQLRAMQQAEARKQRNRSIVITVVVVVAVLAVVGGGIMAWLQLRSGQEATIPPSANEARTGIVMNPDTAGPDAKELEIYFDYQCPACKQFEQQMAGTLESMAQSGEVKITYHTMTFMERNLRNDSSTMATNGAYCADAQGLYEDYHTSVFASQTAEGSGYSEALLREQITQQIGMEGEALTSFQQCFDQKKFDGYVKKVDTEAAKAGITGTPTVRVDGEEIDLKGIGDPEAFREAVLN